MSRWQAVSGAIVTVDLELLDAVHALKSSETLKGNLGCASDKLQELGPVCLVKGAQGPPEPLNLKLFKNIYINLFQPVFVTQFHTVCCKVWSFSDGTAHIHSISVLASETQDYTLKYLFSRNNSCLPKALPQIKLGYSSIHR